MMEQGSDTELMFLALSETEKAAFLREQFLQRAKPVLELLDLAADTGFEIRFNVGLAANNKYQLNMLKIFREY